LPDINIAEGYEDERALLLFLLSLLLPHHLAPGSRFKHTAMVEIAACCSTILVYLSVTVLLLAVRSTAECGDTLPSLPAVVAQTKADIIALAESNVDKWGDDGIQAQLEALAITLEDWYVVNRPANEVETNLGSWRIIWNSNPFYVVDFPGFTTDRDNTYQVVRDGFFYNVAKYDYGFFFKRSITFFFNEASTLQDEANAETCGQRQVNVWSLTSTDMRFRRGWVPTDRMLRDIVDDVDSGEIRTIKIRAPRGGGLDWIRFLDDDIRLISHADNFALMVRDEFVTE
jgi:hypothetical protein